MTDPDATPWPVLRAELGFTPAEEQQIAERAAELQAEMTVPAPDLRDRLVTALGDVRLRLGPNALAMAQRGEAIRLSGGEKDDIADVALGVVQAELDQLRAHHGQVADHAISLDADLAIFREAVSQYSGQLEEARDLMSNAGHNRAHLDDWPDIIPALQDLIAERDQLRAQVAAAGLVPVTQPPGATVLPCSSVLFRTFDGATWAHLSHTWAPQPGVTPVWCPGVAPVPEEPFPAALRAAGLDPATITVHATPKET